jgi:aryl-phospho-beta-D-glucosidase BglC (GH1 family)
MLIDFSPIKTFYRLKQGEIGIGKCIQDNANQSTDCAITATVIIPICNNPRCTHPPIHCGNNVVKPTKDWLAAVQARGHAFGNWRDIGATADQWWANVSRLRCLGSRAIADET